MKILTLFISLMIAAVLSSSMCVFALDSAAKEENKPYPVGFDLVTLTDPSRSYPSPDGTGFESRRLRIYIWYPAKKAGKNPMTVGDLVAMAQEDFSPPSLPVPLLKGLDEKERTALLGKPLGSFRGIEAADGSFPLLVIGQGLYYESPLSQIYLCEHLAGLGYVVATCPLKGTQYRLVNLSAEDLETEVRDMEFVIASARSRKGTDPHKLGIVGYDLGGMAGLLLAMRDPEAAALLSLDSGILTPHRSGLPASHPSYKEDRFVIPWMHMTQARFLAKEKQGGANALLSDRKKYGDSWLVSVTTDNHGQFSSYSKFGIKGGVEGYWRSVAEDASQIHDGIMKLAGDFFDSILKGDKSAAERLEAAASGAQSKIFSIEHKKGAAPEPSRRSLINTIIEKGLAEAKKIIEKMKVVDLAVKPLDEQELDWLGYHFLLWWGRETDALEIFKLNTELNPASADAYASLGEASMILDRKDDARAAFKKAIELNPDIPGVKRALEELEKETQKGK